ncbi:MAG TPA: protease pro-enzyme activation domain-containing protein, partial [Candidatus Sulfotelmatobacter sp.]|nr:protease pro-enzyme activation domain-containing protein [Candidatus Sulfotelmatobacter sp.]
QIVAWLQGEGFTNVHPARGRNWVSFTGNASQVETAFATEIHRYNVNGQMHYANSTAPRIPAGLVGVATGFRGLHDFHPHPMNKQRPRPFWYSTKYAEDFVAPGDIGTIYDINALYTAGIDGTGQKIAVMGQTDVYLADINDFRTGFGLSSITCTTGATGLITACNDPHFVYKLYGSDPGASTQGDISEADLDLEWSGAVARGAEIIYVNSTDTFDSFYDAIDNNLAPVISLSYGQCEFFDNFIFSATGSGHALSNEAELQKANAQGITFVNSSGDSGAAECDFFATVTDTNLATQGLAVSYPASSPEVTGVGGTATPLADWNNPTYWGTSNGSNGGTALSYVPEQAWNDDLEFSQYCQQNSGNKFCTQGGTTAQPGWVSITSEATAQTDIGLSATGGGASNCATENGDMSECVSGFPKPSWQTVTVAGQTTRLSPDVSFLASPNFPGYVFCTPLSELGVNSTSSSCAGGITAAVDTNLSIIGGTSASAPVFAGIVALLNQYTSGTGLGNINPSLYQLAATAPAAFHDVTSGDIKVYCEVNTPAGQLASLLCPSTGVIGYSASAGFDLATGLGSMDVNNFAVALKNPPDFSASTPTTSLSVFDGQTGTTAPITVTPINGFTGSVSFACSGLPAGASCSFNPATVTPPAGTTTVATIQGGGTNTTTPANVVIAASTGTLSTVSHQAASIALTTTAPFTLAADAATFQVAEGSNVAATITVTLATGFSGTISFTCTDQVPASTCTTPNNINASQDVSFQLTTSLPTAKLERPLDRGSRILYAALLPGLFGFVFIAGSRKRSMTAMRIVGLIALLGASTLWMASCGGNSGSGTGGSNGTPKGTYNITVTGISGGASNSATFQLIVQ